MKLCCCTGMSAEEPFAVLRAKKRVNAVALRSMFIAGFSYYEIGRFVPSGAIMAALKPSCSPGTAMLGFTTPHTCHT